MDEFNLVSDQWIPVVRSDGRNGPVSLVEALTDSTIIDLNADPCERIALMRLLLAIAHRASDLSQAVPDYLKYWTSAFDLGDEKGGFLRLPNVTAAKGLQTPSSVYLQFQRRYKPASLTLGEVALGIVTFQCCYPGGLCARDLSVNGTQIIGVSAECSPSMEGGPIYSFIVGKTLLDTIGRNLLPKNAIPSAIGLPVWEKFSVDTFLGRLLPIAYSIAFSPAFQYMSYGPVPHSYQNEMQDPWLAYKADKKGTSTVVRLNSEKSLWRELPAITAVPESGKRRGNLLLQQGRRLEGAQVWAGGLSKFQSDIVTLVESRFDLSESMFEALRNEGYLTAFSDAEKTSSRLRSAVKTYVEASARFNPKGSRPLVPESQMRYWNRLDNTKGILFALMDKHESAEIWTRHCRETARAVFNDVCDPVTAREFKALIYAQSQL